MLNGTRVRGYVCTRCLGSDKVAVATKATAAKVVAAN